MIFSVRREKADKFQDQLRQAKIHFRPVKGPYKDESSVEVPDKFFRAAFHIWILTIKPKETR